MIPSSRIRQINDGVINKLYSLRLEIYPNLSSPEILLNL
jgi:hypothetical protein